mmetsp:Transcript_18995/g.62086  ORF Transcript_18995/g.62086 Transcript_18995/m.62086 type:complete len:234 (-) Transcript_18995:826-1527(-)
MAGSTAVGCGRRAATVPARFWLGGCLRRRRSRRRGWRLGRPGRCGGGGGDAGAASHRRCSGGGRLGAPGVARGCAVARGGEAGARSRDAALDRGTMRLARSARRGGAGGCAARRGRRLEPRRREWRCAGRRECWVGRCECWDSWCECWVDRCVRARRQLPRRTHMRRPCCGRVAGRPAPGLAARGGREGGKRRLCCLDVWWAGGWSRYRGGGAHLPPGACGLPCCCRRQHANP